MFLDQFYEKCSAQLAKNFGVNFSKNLRTKNLLVDFSVEPYYFTAKDVKDKTSKKVVKSDDKKKIYILSYHLSFKSCWLS